MQPAKANWHVCAHCVKAHVAEVEKPSKTHHNIETKGHENKDHDLVGQNVLKTGAWSVDDPAKDRNIWPIRHEIQRNNEHARERPACRLRQLAEHSWSMSNRASDLSELLSEVHTRAFASDSPRMPVGRNMRTTSKTTKAMTSFHCPPKTADP